jgi:dTDP-4-dehydrorhamnose 3,5-epimerase-like enzyme
MEISTLKTFKDPRGSLIPIEFTNLPFVPKRAFVVNNVPVNTVRGEHSHYTTQQLVICTKGSVIVSLHNGIEEKKYTLKECEQIYIPPLIWDSQTFLTEDTEILVLCSTSYDIRDYIFDFSTYMQIKQVV